MDVQRLIEVATTDELPTLQALIQRVATRPAIVVTLDEGGRTRKYVVAQEDEIYFEGLTVEKIQAENWMYRLRFFGGQWLRGYGRVDEMYRSALEMENIVKIERLDPKKVWG